MTTDLIKRLEEATEGSRELDARVACHVTCGSGPFGAYPSAKAWVATALKENWNFARYTTSLDAKLPWENIVEVKYLTSSKRYLAWNAGAKESGFAKTEALARRAAALKAKDQS